MGASNKNFAGASNKKLVGASNKNLVRGWSTGAVATACARACAKLFVERRYFDEIEITLPHSRAKFKIHKSKFFHGWSRTTIIKDAGSDPDVTHRSEITVFLTLNPRGLEFKSGVGVGTITKGGLALKVGSPAINPKPQEMIKLNLIEQVGNSNWTVIISVKDGERLAEQTLNSRLGIVGGLSILGTSGIVIPYSCSAWISSIHRGIDVALFSGISHIVGTTGRTSQRVAMRTLSLSPSAYIEMGDFVGGMLKYISKVSAPPADASAGKHPAGKHLAGVREVTIVGGVAKMVKLSQGARDLHSGRCRVDYEALSLILEDLGAGCSIVDFAKTANTVVDIITELTDKKLLFNFLEKIALGSKATIYKILDSNIKVQIIIASRTEKVLYKG